jgi:DNA replication and repair protein RecF
MEVWNSQLIEFGKQIIAERQIFIDKLNPVISQIHSELSGKTEKIHIIYEPNVTDEYFEEKLFLSEEKDLMLKTTHVGPHRDDIAFIINQKDLRKFGSQGQQRTAALSLKLAEIEIVKSTIKENPVLLLDDVLSELDRKRQNHLLENIKGIQTIFTCTGLEEFIKKGWHINKTFEIESGGIKSCKTR